MESLEDGRTQEESDSQGEGCGCNCGCDSAVLVPPPQLEQNSQYPTKRAIGLFAFALILWAMLFSQLHLIAEILTFDLLRLTPDTHEAHAVEYFLYDAPKVLMLLVLVIYFVGIIRSYFTPEKTRALLAGKRESVGNILAAMLGIVTPFCSCSAVPLFIGFITAGVPLGVTFSFLIAAPLINEVALVLLWALFGWEVALIYLGAGLAIAILSGWIIGRLGLEDWVEDWVYATKLGEGLPEENLLFSDRLEHGKRAVKEVFGKVWPFVLAGVAVGALIHGYVAEDQLSGWLGEGAWWAVPLAVVLGVPMYSNAAGVVPIVEALMGKGVALGTALAFMMSVVALSLPEMVILRKVLKPKLIATFIVVVAIGILIVGYVFNALLPAL